jgi:hypothetical protein
MATMTCDGKNFDYKVEHLNVWNTVDIEITAPRPDDDDAFSSPLDIEGDSNPTHPTVEVSFTDHRGRTYGVSNMLRDPYGGWSCQAVVPTTEHGKVTVELKNETGNVVAKTSVGGVRIR